MTRLVFLLLVISLLQACASQGDYTPLPLQTAAGSGDFDALSSLLEQGKDPNEQNETSGETPLHSAAAGTSPNQAKIINRLVAAGADPNIRGRTGLTPLHVTKTVETVNALVRAGANPESRDQSGATPLHWAQTAEAVNALVAAGSDVNATDINGSTPLHRAFYSTDVVQALLDNGADPNVRSQAGAAPLDLAQSPDVIKALLENGANPDARGPGGYTPVERIRALNNKEAMAVLDDFKAPTGIEGPAGTGSIGVKLVKHGDAIVIDGLVPGAPAANSGKLRQGDRIMGVAQGIDDEFDSLDGKNIKQAAALTHGGVDTPVRLVVLGQGEMHTREVTLKRTEITEAQKQAFIEQSRPLAIKGTSGAYMSPYTSDGVVAEWVDKSINNQMGSAAGSAVGGIAGAAVANKALENIPGGGLIGGFFGSKAGKAVGNKVADDVSGGDAYRRQTSDLSFHSLNGMAAWLVKTHGDKANFGEVVAAANRIYPGLATAVNQAR